jgi:hypothetical protein
MKQRRTFQSKKADEKKTYALALDSSCAEVAEKQTKWRPSTQVCIMRRSC